MMWRHVQRLLGVLVLTALVVGAASTLCADVTITMEQEVKSASGTQTTTVKQYYTPTKMRNEFGQASVSIADLDAGRMITLMPALKTYIVKTFDELRALAAAVRVAESKVTIEETDETEEINGYNCKKVVVRTEMVGNVGNVTVTEHWMTADAEGIDAYLEFQKSMNEAFKDLPQYAVNAEATKKFVEEGLLAIKTVVHMQRPDGEMTSTMTVTKIEEGDLDDELFEVPEDYTEQTMNVQPRGGSSSKE